MALTEFFVIIPDHTSASRSQARPAHLSHITSPTSPYRFGGGYKPLHASPTDDSAGYVGSAIVVMGESVDDVLKKLREDPYAKGGVWDLDRARVLPFKTGESKEVKLG